MPCSQCTEWVTRARAHQPNVGRPPQAPPFPSRCLEVFGGFDGEEAVWGEVEAGEGGGDLGEVDRAHDQDEVGAVVGEERRRHDLLAGASGARSATGPGRWWSNVSAPTCCIESFIGPRDRDP
jgi:hypothetical protein